MYDWWFYFLYGIGIGISIGMIIGAWIAIRIYSKK